MKQQINCVITDLDDTIWNWFDMWYDSFEPYYRQIAEKFKIEPELLKADFKKIHQKYHTTEASFAYQQLTCLNEDQKAEIAKKNVIGKSILHTYNSNKKENLKLYEGVLSTLKKLKEKGVLIIGFTESNSFFTKTRIKHLELDGLFDCIYTPLDDGIPMNTVRFYSEDYWEPKKTEIRHLSKFDKKPDKEIIEIIIKDFKLSKEHTIYIGDKLDRDIQMANDANITSVYAEYGNQIDNSKYALLRQVTHWTDEEVNREVETKAKNAGKIISPKFVLKNSYAEILELFEFYSNESKINFDLLPTAVATWSKVIDVQQHFNNIALTIRNITLTTFTFILAGIGYLYKENVVINLNHFHIPIGSIFSFFGALVIYSFYRMDKNWYHRFLKGAVNQALTIENKWSKHFNELGLSSSISKESNYKHFFCFKKIEIKSNSEHRFKLFYRPLIFVLLIVGGIIILTYKNKQVDFKLYQDKLMK